MRRVRRVGEEEHKQWRQCCRLCYGCGSSDPTTSSCIQQLTAICFRISISFSTQAHTGEGDICLPTMSICSTMRDYVSANPRAKGDKVTALTNCYATQYTP